MRPILINPILLDILMIANNLEKTNLKLGSAFSIDILKLFGKLFSWNISQLIKFSIFKFKWIVLNPICNHKANRVGFIIRPYLQELFKFSNIMALMAFFFCETMLEILLLHPFLLLQFNPTLCQKIFFFLFNLFQFFLTFKLFFQKTA